MTASLSSASTGAGTSRSRLPVLKIRDAVRSDAGVIHSLVSELAEYERLAHAMSATEADFARTLFDEPRVARALIAEWEGATAGLAIYFFNYSTFLARPGLHLEDLFVRPGHRKLGIGRRLLAELARRALAAGCGRMEWAVLDWNEPAIRFYRALGAQPLDEWTVFRLERSGIAALATGAHD